MTDVEALIDEEQVRLRAIQEDMDAVFKKHLPEGVQYTIVTLTEEGDAPGSFRLDVASTLDNIMLRAIFQILIDKTNAAINSENGNPRLEIVRIPPKGDMH